MRQFCPKCEVRLPKAWLKDAETSGCYLCPCGTAVKTRFPPFWVRNCSVLIALAVPLFLNLVDFSWFQMGTFGALLVAVSYFSTLVIRLPTVSGTQPVIYQDRMGPMLIWALPIFTIMMIFSPVFKLLFQDACGEFDETCDAGLSGGAVQAVDESRRFTKIELPWLNAPGQLEYPRLALIENTEGFTEVEMTIDRYGAVIDQRVINSSDSNILDASALVAVSQLDVNPEALGDVEFPHRKQLRFNFVIASAWQ